ncbi:MAG: hypothetical protein ACLP50_36285, partial [Solirubrobacteraceae bacterium]
MLLWALVLFLVPISGAAAAPVISADSGPVNGGSLTDGVPVNGSVTSAGGIAYTFTAVVGQHVTLAITNPDVSPVGDSLLMQVFDSSGAGVGYTYFSTGPAAIDFTPT